MDNAKRTGSGGGKDAKLTEVDHKVLDIIGKESPAVTSLNLPESYETTEGISPNETNSSVTVCSPCNNNIRKTKINSKNEETVAEKKRRKLDLQLDFLNLKNRKLALEVMSMEQQLSVQPSDVVGKYYPEYKSQDSAMVVEEEEVSENNYCDYEAGYIE